MDPLHGRKYSSERVVYLELLKHSRGGIQALCCKVCTEAWSEKEHLCLHCHPCSVTLSKLLTCWISSRNSNCIYLIRWFSGCNQILPERHVFSSILTFKYYQLQLMLSAKTFTANQYQNQTNNNKNNKHEEVTKIDRSPYSLYSCNWKHLGVSAFNIFLKQEMEFANHFHYSSPP